MCVTLGQATLSGTIIYAASVQHEGAEAHVVGYQNRANSRGPNAMILPIPTLEAMGPHNLMDTRAVPWLLEDMDMMCRMRSRSMTKGGPLIGAGVQIFDSGSYTVVLATDAESIPQALQYVPEHKRPTVAPGFFTEYAKLYPGWPIAVCCWSGTIKAEPLLWWYRPRFPKWLFFPAVDAHSGQPPVPGDVRVDHTLIWGDPAGEFASNLVGPMNSAPSQRQPLPSTILPLIAPRLSALRPNGTMPNGDFWVREGSKPRRIFPNGFAEVAL